MVDSTTTDFDQAKQIGEKVNKNLRLRYPVIYQIFRFQDKTSCE